MLLYNAYAISRQKPLILYDLYWKHDEVATTGHNKTPDLIQEQ